MFLKNHTKPLKPSGDTIVEVLISIAIAGLVIAGSYALANRSLRQGITASERTEAIKIAEGQVEALKVRKQKSTPSEWSAYFTQASTVNNSCLNVTDNDPAVTSSWRPVQNSATPPISPGTSDQPSNLRPKGDLEGGFYDPVCIVSGKYFINTTIPTSGGIPAHLVVNPTYLITVRWDAIGGGQNSSQLYYRF